LIRDLKQRGLPGNTLVVWSGEFGRVPMVEIRNTRGVNTSSAIVRWAQPGLAPASWRWPH
jgi:Protein of unknown function (DUF1501)